MPYIILPLLGFIFGFVSGMWAGFLYVPATAGDGEPTLFELISLTFTVLGGTGGILATIFALYVYWQWRTEQRKAKAYETRVTILKHLLSISTYTNNYLVAIANPKSSNVNEHRVNLIVIISSIAVEIEILNIFEKLGDTTNFMRINEVCAEILSLTLFPNDKDFIDKFYVSSIHEWSGDFIRKFFDGISFEPSGEHGIRCYRIKDVMLEFNKLNKSIKEELKSGI